MVNDFLGSSLKNIKQAKSVKYHEVFDKKMWK
jgi:hypothetical protein